MTIDDADRHAELRSECAKARTLLRSPKSGIDDRAVAAGERVDRVLGEPVIDGSGDLARVQPLGNHRGGARHRRKSGQALALDVRAQVYGAECGREALRKPGLARS